MEPEGHQFISVQKKQKGIEVFIKDATKEHNQLFLEHETFLDTLPKQKEG
jgi:hypothetical protein